MDQGILATAMFIDQLTASVPRIEAAAARLTPAELRAAPASGEWSVTQILAHLRSCADVWGGCIARILSEDRPTIRAVNPRTWIRSTDYRELPFESSFEVFASQRVDLLATLQRTAPDAWSRLALVTGAGADREQDIHGYVRRMTLHEGSHVKQIERIAAGG